MTDILIFEDDKFFIDDLRDLLGINGISCDIYDKPLEFKERVGSISEYKAVFLDVMARRLGLDGDGNMETGEILYQIVRCRSKNIPVVILTAKNQSDIENIDFSNSETYYFKKPLGINVDDILKIIGIL